MTKKPNEIERMRHMIEGIDKIFDYTKEISENDFLKNSLIQDAVIKNFEVIGEAAYQISKEIKDKYSFVVWKQIEGLRHILVHDYYKINPAILWNTKENNLTDLKTNLEKIIIQELNTSNPQP